MYVTFRRRCFVTKYWYRVQVFRYEIPLRNTFTKYLYEVLGTGTGTRYRYEVHVQVQVRGAWVQVQVQARGTGTGIGTAVQVRGRRYRYRYHKDWRYCILRYWYTYEVPSTGIKGTRYRYRYRYEVQVRGKSIQLQVSFVLPRVPSVSSWVRLYVERLYAWNPR